MAVDAYLNWGDGLQFGPSNDLRLASSRTLAEQRVIRRLLTNPVQVDSNNKVVKAAGNRFAQTYGAGLSQDVDGVSDASHRADREQRIHDAMAIEASVDQTQPVNVVFATNPTIGVEYIIVTFTAVDGSTGQVAIPS